MMRLQLVLLVVVAACGVALSARLPREAEAEPAPTAAVNPEAVEAEKKGSEDEKKGSEDEKKEKPVSSKTNKTEGYTSKFDNIDLDQILKSDRLVNNYFKCLMDRGPCTPDGAELKRVLPDALESECSKCSEKQRSGSERVIEHIIRNKPAQWKELQAKYDPKGTYKSKYEMFTEERGLKVEAAAAE